MQPITSSAGVAHCVAALMRRGRLDQKAQGTVWGHRPLPLPSRKAPRFIYGDIISRMAKARGLTCIPINLGSGGRPAAASDVGVLAKTKLSVVSVLMGYNDQSWRTPAGYKAELGQTLVALRERLPQTPIFVLTLLWSTHPHPTTHIRPAMACRLRPTGRRRERRLHRWGIPIST